MKKLGKLLSVLVISLVLGVSSISAMTEDELKAKLTAAYTVNGVKVQATADQIVQIERYLAQNDISSADADYIATKVDAAITVMESGSATTIKNMTSAEKERIKTILNEVAQNTSVKLTVSKGEITVYNTDNTVFSKVTESAVKYTNNTTTLVITIAGVIVLAGVVIAARKMSKLTNA